MGKEYPFSEEVQKSFRSKLELFEKLIRQVKEDYSLNNLETLRKETHRIASEAETFGYSQTAELCRHFELDLVTKAKNFYLSQPSQSWFDGLGSFMKEVENSFAAQNKIKQEEQAKDPNLKKEQAREKKKRIIIVDDDEDLLKLLTHEFVQIGFDVKSFKAGEEALAFLLDEKNLSDVFLLILDRMLPDMDGLDILQQFSAQSSVRIPVLILSALASEKDITAGLQGGAIDYIGKPFSVFMLMQKAINLMKSQNP